jgi:hypothetical protein
VVRRERIGSEWSELRLEDDPGDLTEDLLEVARLARDRDRMEAALGPVWYRRALAFAPLAAADRSRPARAGPVHTGQT